MSRDYEASYIRSKIDILKDLLEHIENNDIDTLALKEYYVELRDSLNKRIRKV